MLARVLGLGARGWGALTDVDGGGVWDERKCPKTKKLSVGKFSEKIDR